VGEMTEIETLGDGLLAEEFMYDVRLQQLIDDALDKNDEEEFMKLTKLLRNRELKTIKG